MLGVILFLFLMGLIWGSFLNVVIVRLSQGGSPLSGRSACPKCKHLIPWHMNIPLLSFVLLRGKCAFCHKKISIQYPLIEFLTGIFFVWWFVVGFNFFKLVGNPWVFIQPLFWLVTGMVMLSILVIDLLYMVIPFSLNLTLFTLALLYRVGLTSFGIMEKSDFIRALSCGMVLGLGLFLLQSATRMIKKVDGFGWGDIYLVPSLGLLLGWPKTVPGIFLAFVLGSVVGLSLIILKKKKMSQYLPFGPFLILGTGISLIWGQAIWSWYIMRL
jgi:leader peptidase (prepilin peptidase)/N-methyltransferase